MESVLIYSLKDVYLGKGRQHDRQTGDRPGILNQLEHLLTFRKDT